jgi:hypothetical protein
MFYMRVLFSLMSGTKKIGGTEKAKQHYQGVRSTPVLSSGVRSTPGAT